MNADSGPDDERPEILAVEDSPTQAELLRYLLEQSGFRATVSSTGAQALALLGERAPSAIISDITMPGMSGYELCRRIRADKRTRDIPVILLTSLASSEDVMEGLACGADSFITKPYSKHYLITNIQQVLANRQPGKDELPRINVEVSIAGKTHSVAADRQRIITLLLSTYEAAAHQNAGLREAQEELRTVNDRLEEKVRERTAALEADITERKAVEAELVKYRNHLEELVHARTEELELANNELEAFSYSVSHDLRAPLRAINGFAQALQEDCSAQLDTVGLDYLDRMRASSRSMARLIDDLLTLARTSRLPLERKPVNLSELARTIADELQEAEPTRKVELVIPDSMTAQADPVLAEMVLRNLLGNAWKFTGRHSTARIEVGQTVRDGEPVWFIRDDGAGFDMSRVDSLSKPFRRLHASADFAGTGIGLATVQRIVLRHGGRGWIEGVVEKGATFYFTFQTATREA